MEQPFQENGSYEEKPAVYTMPAKFLPQNNNPKKKSGKGLIIALYTLIALVVVGGAGAVWYLFFYDNSPIVPEVNKVIPVIPSLQPTSTTPVVAEGVDVKFVARDTTGNEVGYVNMKLAATDVPLANDIKATSLLPDQMTGRAQQAIGAVYSFSSVSGDQLNFSEPVSFEFHYVEPDNLTSKKENSLQIAEEISDGGWKYIANTSLDIVANVLTVKWSELPQGRVTILSNLDEELLAPLPTSTTTTTSEEFITTPLTKTTDSDGDGLTDVEETLYQTNASLPDTDNDGYIDGLELEKGYNPTGEGTLESASLVKKYISDELKFNILYPATWLATGGSGEIKTVTFESNQDDFIQISTQENSQKLSVRNWYAQLVPGTNQSSLEDVVVSDLPGIYSLDKANVYVAAGDKIYILTYSAGLKTSVDFLATFAMMRQSLSITGNVN
jgi:hypothetical protein